MKTTSKMSFTHWLRSKRNCTTPVVELDFLIVLLLGAAVTFCAGIITCNVLWIMLCIVFLIVPIVKYGQWITEGVDYEPSVYYDNRGRQIYEHDTLVSDNLSTSEIHPDIVKVKVLKDGYNWIIEVKGGHSDGFIKPLKELDLDSFRISNR